MTTYEFLYLQKLFSRVQAWPAVLAGRPVDVHVCHSSLSMLQIMSRRKSLSIQLGISITTGVALKIQRAMTGATRHPIQHLNNFCCPLLWAGTLLAILKGGKLKITISRLFETVS